VVCVDLQPQMIAGLRRRAQKARLLDRIDTIVCAPDDLGAGAWAGKVDLALAIHVVHEIPDPDRFLRQVYDTLRPGGRFLIREPKGHVSETQFAATIESARATGFRCAEPPSPSMKLSALLVRE
jgi:SAM-dependent methyltransferase